MSSQGVLGQAHRIIYTSKNLVSGLTDVRAYVIKPDLTRVGPYPLSEFADPKFSGFYAFEFPTAPTDSQGEYIGVVESPSENSYRTPFKIIYSSDRAILENIESKTINLPGDPASDTTVITRSQLILDDLADVVRIDDLSSISGVFSFQAKMSTVYKSAEDKHEVMTWLERNNVRLLNTSTCKVTFKRADGSVVWQATQASPNVDGFFTLESPQISLEADRNFYVIIEINDEDDVKRTTTLPTYTVG